MKFPYVINSRAYDYAYDFYLDALGVVHLAARPLCAVLELEPRFQAKKFQGVNLTLTPGGRAVGCWTFEQVQTLLENLKLGSVKNKTLVLHFRDHFLVSVKNILNPDTETKPAAEPKPVEPPKVHDIFATLGGNGPIKTGLQILQRDLSLSGATPSEIAAITASGQRHVVQIRTSRPPLKGYCLPNDDYKKTKLYLKMLQNMAVPFTVWDAGRQTEHLDFSAYQEGDISKRSSVSLREFELTHPDHPVAQRKVRHENNWEVVNVEGKKGKLTQKLVYLGPTKEKMPWDNELSLIGLKTGATK